MGMVEADIRKAVEQEGREKLMKMQCKKIRVLQILSGLGMGGIEMFVMNLYKNIDRTSVQFDFLCVDRERNVFLQDILDMGGRVYYCRPADSRLGNVIYKALMLKKLIRQNKYEIVHIHSCSLSGMVEWVIPAKIFCVKHIIAHGHNPGTPKGVWYDKYYRIVMKSIISHCADCHFACSKDVARSKFSNKVIKQEKFKIICNAIPLDKYQFDLKTRINLRKKLDLGDKLTIGSISRFEHQKNHRFMIEIFEKIVLKRKDAMLLLVGTGRLEEEIKKEVRGRGMEENVIFVGMTKEAAQYYQAMDVYLSASFYEGLGISLIEAQTCGLPCVSAPVPEETHICRNFYEISLNESAEVWADAILNIKMGTREDGYKKVRQAGFEIKEEALKMQNFYIGLSGTGKEHA